METFTLSRKELHRPGLLKALWAAATWAFVSRPPHSAFNSPGRCSSFRLNVKVSIEGGPFHGAVRGGHLHVATSTPDRAVLTALTPRGYCSTHLVSRTSPSD